MLSYKDPVGWDIFNFINFENLIYMKLYSLLILNKNTKKSKNNFKAPKKELNSYISRSCMHVNKSQQCTSLYTTYSHVLDGDIKAIAANWCLIVRTWGDTPATLIVCIKMWPNALGTFNRPLASVKVYKKFVWVLSGIIEMSIKNIFLNLKIKSWSGRYTTSLQN